MKNLIYLFAFVVAMISCSKDNDVIINESDNNEINTPQATRGGVLTYIADNAGPQELILNEHISYVLYYADAQDDFLSKLRESEIKVYHHVEDDEGTEDLYGSRCYNIWVVENYKELEKMDEVLYAAPFAELSMMYNPEFPVFWGEAFIEGWVYFSRVNSSNEKMVADFAEENGLNFKAKLPEYPGAPLHSGLFFTKHSKLEVLDAISQLREKGIDARLPGIWYTLEGRNW